MRRQAPPNGHKCHNTVFISSTLSPLLFSQVTSLGSSRLKQRKQFGADTIQRCDKLVPEPPSFDFAVIIQAPTRAELSYQVRDIMPPPATRGWSLSQLWRDDDEEMASKKDDDLGLPRHAKQSDQWQAAPKSSLHWTTVLRLIVYAAALFMLVYGLFRVVGPAPGASSLDPSNLMPLYDTPRPPPRYDTPRMEEEGPTIKTPKAPKPPKPQAESQGDSGSGIGESKTAAEAPRTYNGPLKLPNLGPSLQAIMTDTSGRLQKNRNILFAAASLRSAALLLPMACQMATERQNYVHFALMSRNDMPMKELLAINGIDKECPLIVHGTIAHVAH